MFSKVIVFRCGSSGGWAHELLRFRATSTQSDPEAVTLAQAEPQIAASRGRGGGGPGRASGHQRSRDSYMEYDHSELATSSVLSRADSKLLLTQEGGPWMSNAGA